LDVRTPLDRQIAVDYTRFLLDRDVADSAQARKDFCEEKKIHPKLLYFNPHMADLARLFGAHSNFERLQDMTLRDWMLYHHHYVHQAYRYGDREMQQTWLGHDILKSPMDCWIYQELIARIKPDVLIELGVMFGGASHFYASIMDLVGHGTVLGIDISLAKVKALDNERIQYIEGSSTSDETLAKVRELVQGKTVLVIADSDHEKNHVLNEMRAYAPFVTKGSYFVAEDSLNDVMHWHPVPNEGPQAAVHAFLKENDDFVVDLRYAEKYIMTLSPYGFLQKVK
jgi:cephalosporin hydroxylase